MDWHEKPTAFLTGGRISSPQHLHTTPGVILPLQMYRTLSWKEMQSIVTCETLCLRSRYEALSFFFFICPQICEKSISASEQPRTGMMQNDPHHIICVNVCFGRPADSELEHPQIGKKCSSPNTIPLILFARSRVTLCPLLSAVTTQTSRRTLFSHKRKYQILCWKKLLFLWIQRVTASPSIWTALRLCLAPPVERHHSQRKEREDGRHLQNLLATVKFIFPCTSEYSVTFFFQPWSVELKIEGGMKRVHCSDGTCSAPDVACPSEFHICFGNLCQWFSSLFECLLSLRARELWAAWTNIDLFSCSDCFIWGADEVKTAQLFDKK